MISKQATRKLLVFSATALLTGVVAIAQSAGGGGSMQQPTMPSQQTNTTPGMPPNGGAPDAQNLDDKDFVKKALEGGDAEVQLGQLAQQKSQSDDVKQFGQKMVSDHTQLDNQVMKPIAQQIGVKAPKGPSKKDSKMIATMGALSGAQFDQEYIKAMLKDHKQDLKDFKSEENMTQNPNLKKAAQEGQTVISQHLQMIEQIAQAHNVTADAK